MSTGNLKVGLPSGGPDSMLRVQWLDGVRALAAIFVVLHHAWLMTVGGYPGNNGPWFTNWLAYGHLAVSVFIVVSGYSLALSPIRNGLRFKDGGAGFLRHRFWRIVPPYWSALILVTILIATGLTDPANGRVFGMHDFLVHFFLIQDAVGNVSPNGAFWSIAVEWHIYFLYPMILLLFRRWGLQVVVLAILGLVVAQHLVSVWVPAVAALNRFTPVYLFLFACGVAAAWLVHRKQAAKTSVGVAAGLLSGFLAYATIAGTAATIDAYFWVDLTIGCITAALFVALDQGRLRWAALALSWRPLVIIGSFAFSLYLTHAPVLAMITTYIVRPLQAADMLSLTILIVVGLPASIGASYVFFLVFERPFLTIRSFGQLSSAIRDLFRIRRVSLRRFRQAAPPASSNIPSREWKKKS